MQHFSDRSKLRNLCHFFCPLMGWVVDSAQPWISTTLPLLLIACSILLFSSFGGLLFPSHSFPIHFFLHPFVFSLPKLSSFSDKKPQKHKKPHVPTLLFITGINILVNNLINHMRLRTLGANPTATEVHPLCEQKWKSLEGCP